MNVEKQVECVHCNKVFSLNVDEEKFNLWTEGQGLIQDLLGNLSAGERELLISGTCDDCWDKQFSFNGGEDEDEDEE